MKHILEALDNVIHELQPAKKDTENPFFNSKYADLNQLLAAIKPLCKKHGLIIFQHPVHQVVTNPGSTITVLCGVQTILSHAETEGQISVPCLLPVDKLSPQQGGSAITYARRYALNCIFALESVDDDGNTASRPPKEEAKVDNGKIVAAYKASMFSSIDGKALEVVYKQTKDDPILTPEEKTELHNYAMERNTKLKEVK